MYWVYEKRGDGELKPIRSWIEKQEAVDHANNLHRDWLEQACQTRQYVVYYNMGDGELVHTTEAIV